MTAAGIKLPDPVADFARACDIGGLDHLGVTKQREALCLLSNLNFLRFGEPGPALTSVTDHTLGSGRVRLYRPSMAGAQPVHLCLHGGGWWQGSIDDLVNDATCRYRAAASGVTVAAVDYRLAPEHPYPAAVQDCCAALDWLVSNQSKLGVDASSLSIGGNSAGANLAAATALALRDRADIEIVLQVLEVPALDLTLATLAEALAEMNLPERSEELDQAVGVYLQDPSQADDPFVSPLLATDLTGLPPALIAVAEHDPLKLEGRRYADRLAAAGVETTLVELGGALHGALLLTRTWEPAIAWQRDAADTLRVAHGIDGTRRPTVSIQTAPKG